MIKELRLATGRRDAKAHGQMKKKNLTERELRGIESGNKSRKSLIWCLFTVFVKKKIHDDVLIRINNKYNQAFNLRLTNTNNKLYSNCKSCLWRLLGTLLSTRNLLINYKYFSLTKGRRIFFLTTLIIKKLRLFKKSTIGINFIQVKYPHLRRLESLC